MNAQNGMIRMAAVARAMAFLRWRQLFAVAPMVRLLLVCVAVFALLFLVVDKGDAPRFWQLAAGMLALKLLPVLCLAKAGESLRNELKDGTMEYLWTRPVGRSQLFLGLFVDSVVGASATAFALVVGASVAGMALGVTDGISELAIFALGAAAAAISFSAISMAMATLTGKYTLLGLLYFALVELGLSMLPTGARQVAITYHLRRLMASLGEIDVIGGSGAVASALLSVTAIAVFFAAVGAVVFSVSSYSVGSDKDA